MSLSTLIQFAERLFNNDTNGAQNSQTTRTSQSEQIAQKLQAQSRRAQKNGNSDEGDRYTPSQRSGVAGPADSATSIDFERLRFSVINLTGQPASATSTAGSEPAQGPTATPVAQGTLANQPIAVPAATATPVSPTAVVPANTPQVASSPTASTPAATTTSSGSSTQAQLQQVNGQLAALGLTPSEIRAFDQAAQLIEQISPSAFQDIVNQLNALAGQFAAQGNTTAGTSGAPATSPAATPSAAPSTPANPGFQLSEFSLSFSGINESIQSQGQNGAASTTEVSGFQLQLEEVHINLTSASGQTAQLQTPQKATVAAAAATSIDFERLRFSVINLTGQPASATSTAGSEPAQGPTATPVAQGTLANQPIAVPAATATPVSPTAVVPANNPQVASSPTASTPAATTTSSGSSTQAQLQQVNGQLAALGLTPSEIRAFDQAAQLIEQISPNAFQDIVNQLNALAGQFAAQGNTTAGTSGAPATSAAAGQRAPSAVSTPTATPAATPSTASTPASPGFQLSEFSLSFSGVNESVQSQGQNGAASTTEVSGFQLQVEDVHINLTSASGQTAQLQTPQKTTTAAAASA